MEARSAPSGDRDYVPAAPQLWAYDLLCVLLSGARRWRPLLTRQIAPRAGERIAEVGVGTGSQLLSVARAAPAVSLLGLDPDPPALERARRKLARAGVSAELVRGYARDTAKLLGEASLDKIFSSLVFHQVPPEEKRAGLASMLSALRPGGSLHLADYGLQRTAKMRRRFRLVQKGDGFENTEPNALGVLPEWMAEAGFRAVRETGVIETPTGSVSIYRAERAPSA